MGSPRMPPTYLGTHGWATGGGGGEARPRVVSGGFDLPTALSLLCM